MSELDTSRELRGATYRGDGVAVVAALRMLESRRDHLQVGGEGLLVALEQDVEGAAALVGTWVEELHDRDWDGDEELAEQLAGESGAALLPTLPVDLDQLASALEGGPDYGGGHIDLSTGEIREPPSLMFGEEDDEPDDGHRLEIVPGSSRVGYRDMERFIATVPDDARRGRLAVAIDGRGAFRRFKDVLDRWPDEGDRWRVYSDERRRGRARAWLADAGYRAVPRRA